MVPGTIYKDEPYKACLYCTPYKDKQGQPNTRRKKCDLGSNQEPMRVRFGGGVGCVFLAVFLAVSTSASGSRGVSNRFHSVPSIWPSHEEMVDQVQTEQSRLGRGQRYFNIHSAWHRHFTQKWLMPQHHHFRPAGLWTNSWYYRKSG